MTAPFPLLLALSAYLVLVAMLIGSFINLAADRLPRGESILRPRSHCRACGRVLDTIDLLPVAGFLIRRGRCATCGTSIGMASPVIEAVSGGCMLVAILGWGLWPGALFGMLLVAGVGASVTGAALCRSRPSGVNL